MSKQYAVTRCHHCGAPVALAWDRTYICRNCGYGTLKPVAEKRIRWVAEEDLIYPRKTLVLSREG